jgi:hypothetical protein
LSTFFTEHGGDDIAADHLGRGLRDLNLRFAVDRVDKLALRHGCLCPAERHRHHHRRHTPDRSDHDRPPRWYCRLTIAD